MERRIFHYYSAETSPEVACGNKGALNCTNAWEFVTCIHCKRTKVYRKIADKHARNTEKD